MYFVKALALCIGGVLGVSTLAAQPQTTATSRLSADDVSWLFPPPTSAQDFERLISMDDLTAPDPQDPTKRVPVWSDSRFREFLEIVGATAANVNGANLRIGLPPEAQSRAAWYIAGVRIDAGAPGLSHDMQSQFGQSPEIRLIIQPVGRAPNGSPVLGDIAAHVVFGFVSGFDPPAQGSCPPRPRADATALRGIISDLLALRDKLNGGDVGGKRISTAGLPLGVHPGLADPATARPFRQEIKAFLEKHVSDERLSAMAVAGVPAGANSPWIFVSMINLPDGHGLAAVPSPVLDGVQKAQAFTTGTPRVVPQPYPNNRNPITCSSAVLGPNALPIKERQGASTSDLFANQGLSTAKAAEILALIDDPGKSHFFNTDCVSCHTETRFAMDMQPRPALPQIDPASLPPGPYTVRNFGWSPQIDGVRGVATQRVATETAAVLEFINSHLDAK